MHAPEDARVEPRLQLVQARTIAERDPQLLAGRLVGLERVLRLVEHGIKERHEVLHHRVVADRVHRPRVRAHRQREVAGADGVESGGQLHTTGVIRARAERELPPPAVAKTPLRAPESIASVLPPTRSESGSSYRITSVRVARLSVATKVP